MKGTSRAMHFGININKLEWGIEILKKIPVPMVLRDLAIPWCKLRANGAVRLVHD